MGKVKQLFQEMWEEKLLRDEKRMTSSSGSRNDSHKHRPVERMGKVGKVGNVENDDQAQSDMVNYEQYRKEFEEWLDAYEKSFADKDGKLP